jgi:hypothetical protein
MLDTNKLGKKDPRKTKVFETKEELNNEKQTTPIETSVTAREIFQREDEYEECLAILRKRPCNSQG